MTALTVVAYNVLFGDAILVCIPEREGRKTVMRHVLVDVGNVLAGPGSGSGVFRSVIEDIERRLDKQPIDLYVMTHEHMDHVQGLLRARALRLALARSMLRSSAATSCDASRGSARLDACCPLLRTGPRAPLTC